MTDATVPKKPISKYVVLGAIGLMIGARMLGGTQSQTTQAQTQSPFPTTTQPIAPPEEPTQPPQPTYGDISELLALGMTQYSNSQESRAEQYLKSAQASGNAELYLVRQLAEKYEVLYGKAQRYGTFGGTIDEIRIVRDQMGEVLAILRALQLIQDGQTVTGIAAQPEEFLSLVRDRLGQYSLEYPQLAREWNDE